MKSIVFHFDVISPYAYLAFEHLPHALQGCSYNVEYRPLLFATADPEVAAARGVPVRALGIVFAALVGVVAAQGVQIVGALLVMSLLITPAAAAARVFSSPVAVIAASVV